jgi:two-component system, cell cycle sensor histidine kinase and response regulator CckA
MTGLQEELERLRRRISELESRRAGDEHTEALRANETRYQLLLDTMVHGVQENDCSGVITYSNRAHHRILGYENGELAGKAIWQLQPPGGEQAALREYLAYLVKEQPKPAPYFTVSRRKDGSLVDLQIDWDYQRDSAGRLKGFISVITDITERKQAAAKLRYVTRLYAFLSQINQAIVRTKDRDELFRNICQVAIEFGRFTMAWVGLIDEATGAVRPVTHAGREDGYLSVISIRISDDAAGRGPTGSALREGALAICDDIATDPRMLPWREEALQRGYRSSAAIPVRMKEKTIGSLNLYAAEPGFFAEDERRLLTEIGVDISFALDSLESEKERQRAEDALRVSEHRYRTLFETMAQGVVYQAPDGRIISANAAAERILGVSIDQMQGRTSVDPRWRAIREDGSDFPGDRHPAMVAMGTGRPVNGVIMGVFHPGYNEYRWILIDAIPEYLPGETKLYQVYSTFTDITDRKRAEEALKESEEQYRAIFDGIGDAVFVHRPDEEGPTGHFIAVNDVACRHLGYTREDLLALSLPQVDPLDEAVIPSVLEALRAGREALFETVHITKEGRRVPVEVHARIISYLGAPAILSVARDITDRKRAGEELRRRTQGLATLLEVSKSLAATLDLERVLQATTDGVTKPFGLDTAAVYLSEGETLRLWATTPPLPPQVPEDLRCAQLNDHPHIREAIASGMPVLVPDMTAAVLTPAERAITDQRDLRSVLFLPLIAGVKSVGALIVGSVGKPRVISDAEIDLYRTLANFAALAVENARLYKSGQQYTTELERMLTEHRKAEEALKESEDRFRTLLARVDSVAVQGFGPDGVVHYWNKASERLYGYSAEEAQGRSILDLIVPQELRDQVASAIRQMAETSLPLPSSEVSLLCKDGSCVIVHANYAVVNMPGRAPELYCIDIDLTGRKRAEQERLDLERRLLHAQKLESLGVLAGGIAHDFNNLLMAVLGNLDLALQKVSPVSPARLNIEQSAQAARRATDLTRQMLAYSGRGSFIVKAMDLSELVEENTHLFRSSVARTATLDVRLGRSLPSIEADAGQVQQVIMNLITNASEAIGDRAGTITITTGVQECDAQRLRRSRNEDAPPPGRFVYLEVSDTGSGMDDQTQARLFDPFFTTKAPGRGLGMSAILGIVRGHSGAIFVESSPGKGTSIRILFPALEGGRVESRAPASGRTAGAGAPPVSGKVLVVDDEEIVRKVCKDMVEALGLPVLTAVDGRDAVDLFTKHADEIAVVILDLSMPNMDGMTAFQELVRIRPGVKVILSSGYDELDSIKRLSGRGLAGFIQKPYSLNNLRDALESAGRSGG